MVPCTATLDVDQAAVWHFSALLNAERRRRGTRTGARSLTCYKQAVLILRWFRDDTAIDALVRENHISRATGYRYVDEGIDVLADQVPDLYKVLEQARLSPEDPLILDGKLFLCDRCSEPGSSGESDLWYSGHKHHHGGNIQFLSDARGEPVWLSEVEPGSTADITAARLHVFPLLHKATAEGLVVLADPGYEGAGVGVRTPIKRPPEVDERRWHVDDRAHNRLLRGLRCIGERRDGGTHRPVESAAPHHDEPLQDRDDRASRVGADQYRKTNLLRSPQGAGRRQNLLTLECYERYDASARRALGWGGAPWDGAERFP